MGNIRRARTLSPPPSHFGRRREGIGRLGRDMVTRSSVSAMTAGGGGGSGAATEPSTTPTTVERRTRQQSRSLDRPSPPRENDEAATDAHESHSSCSASNSASNISTGLSENSPSVVAALASRLNATSVAAIAIAPSWLGEPSRNNSGGGGGGGGGESTSALLPINAPVDACASTVAKSIVPRARAPHSGATQSRRRRTSPAALSRDGPAPTVKSVVAEPTNDTSASAPLTWNGQGGVQPPAPPCDAPNGSGPRSSSCLSSRSVTAVGPPTGAAPSTPQSRTSPCETRGSSGNSFMSGGAASVGRVSPPTGAPAAVSLTQLPPGATTAIRSTAEPPPQQQQQEQRHASTVLAYQPLGPGRQRRGCRNGASTTAIAATSASAVPLAATTLASPVELPRHNPAAAPCIKTPRTPSVDTTPAEAAAAAPGVALPAMGALASEVGTLLTYQINENAVVIVDAATVPDDLVCGVCMSVCCQPTATTCGHLFCRRCLQTWMRTTPEAAMCPLDRTPLIAEQLHTDARAQRQINALQCRCPASLPRAVQLELRGVEATTPTGETPEDDTANAADTEHCSWQGCISDAAAHLRQCPHVFTACPFAVHGCTVHLTQAQIPQHVEEDLGAHLLLVSQALVASATQCRVLQEEVDVLRQRCTIRVDRGSLRTVRDEDDDRGGHDAESPVAAAAGSVNRRDPSFSVSPASSDAGLVIPPPAAASAAAPRMHASSFLPPTSTSHRGVVLDAAALEDAAVDSGAVLCAESSITPPHPSNRPIYHQMSTRPHRPPLNVPTFPMHTVGRAMAGAPGGGAPPPAAYGFSDFAQPADVVVSPMRTPSPPQSSMTTAASAVAPMPMNSASAAVSPHLHTAMLAPLSNVALAASQPSSLSGSCSHARGTDQFVWVIPDVAELQAPCYSRVFGAHGLPWYLGINPSPSWERCGVFLFAVGHDRRVDFRVVLFHDDASRDVEHIVRDWREDFIGKGWGPLHIINRFRLEQEGFLERGCLRIGIEVISDPY